MAQAAIDRVEEAVLLLQSLTGAKFGGEQLDQPAMVVGGQSPLELDLLVGGGIRVCG